MSHNEVLNELYRRINDARDIDEHDVVFALENFLDWYLENLIIEKGWEFR